MENKAKIKLCIALLCLLCGIARTDSGWGDSLAFLLNTLTLYDNGGIGMADSPAFSMNLLSTGKSCADSVSTPFSLNLYPVNRAYADSDNFTYNWSANCTPTPAWITLPPWANYSNKLLELDSNGDWQVAGQSCPAPDSTLIVINHGWNDSPYSSESVQKNGILDLAREIQAAVPDAKIYSWDWASDANPNGKSADEDFLNIGNLLALSYLRREVGESWTNAQQQGNQLGISMKENGLTPENYHIHFIGHSFGGVVSAIAANYLYSQPPYQKVEQLTTIETPGLSWPDAIKAINPDSAQRVEAIYYDWHRWLSVGGVGGPAQTADNVINLSLAEEHYPSSLASPAHSRAMEWYIDSVFSMADCAPDYCVYYGFNWSFASSHRPAELKTGLWNEDILNRGCLVAEGRTEQQKNIFIKNAEKAKESFDSLSSWSGTNAQQAIESIDSRFSSFLRLGTSGTPLQIPQGGKMMAMADSEPNNNSAGVFKQILIPINADDLQIDVRFRQVCPGDWLTVSIDGDIILYIDAATEGVSEEFKTFSAAVQKYAGKMVTLQITLESNGTEQTIADIDNLRFTELTMGADVNEDGRVDVLDLIAMSEYWMGPVFAKGDASDKADITQDGKIDLDDFAALSENWLWQKTGYIPGDLDGDGSVNMGDLAIVSSYWQGGCDTQTRCQGADFEPDGDVDIDDLLFLAEHWLEGT